MAVGFLNQDKIIEVTKKADNLISRQLVDMATAQAMVFTPQETNAWPAADFDLEYFTKVMVNLFKTENHNTLREILDGKDLRWWGDEDFGE